MQNPNEEQIHQVEIDITVAQKSVEVMEALERLEKNKDFKLVITEGYFKEEASRAVLLKADFNAQGEMQQKQMDHIIIGIGYLRQYFGKIFHQGEMSAQGIKADAETRAELLQERLAEENVADIGTVQ
jgi:hypothetical protein